MKELCATCWIVRSTAFAKVINNYGQLMHLWDVCLQENFTLRDLISNYWLPIPDDLIQVVMASSFLTEYIQLPTTCQGRYKKSMSANEGQKTALSTLLKHLKK